MTVVAETWSYSSEEPFREEYELSVSPEGAFSGEIELPEDADLGEYQLFYKSPIMSPEIGSTSKCLSSANRNLRSA